MKKIVFTLVILMAMIFTGMQSANAQATVFVQWNDDNCDDCPSLGDCAFRIDIEIIDQCGEDHVTVYQDDKTILCPDEETDFILTYSCLDVTLEPCYLVIATVKKLCPDGHGGYTVICQGKHGGLHYSCHDLMDSNEIIPLTNIILN